MDLIIYRQQKRKNIHPFSKIPFFRKALIPNLLFIAGINIWIYMYICASFLKLDIGMGK
jgi:hypothetical protein